MISDIIDLPKIEETDDKIVELNYNDYQALCSAILTYQKQIAHYEALVTKLQELVNAQDQKIKELGQVIQENARNPFRCRKMKFMDSKEIN